ncbi:TolC family protein [Chamaesiphon sp.]|uniref:TolC family protein n=1 Tax=Chamaesiphon sp. TaxID=2814140 RepID=UPI0035947977
MNTNLTKQRAIQFKAICVISALILSSASGMAAAASIPSADARRLQPDRSMLLAQNTPSNIGKINNDLNLPKTGADVQITNTKSLTLKDAIDIAFRNNRDVQVARLAVDRDTAGIRSAQADQALQIGLTSTLQNQGSPVIFGTQATTSTNSNVQGQLQATYIILDAGRNSSSVRAAEGQVKFSKLDLLRIEQKLRGDVTTAYYDLQAADSPQVSLFANYNLGKTLTDSTSAQDSYSVGAQLSWSFWDGGAARANSDTQKVNQEINENQLTTQRNQIRFEIERAYYSLGTNKKNITTATQSLQQAEESLKLARLRFQAGIGTQTDVIQAQTELATARGNRVSAILNYNRALASLRVATVLVE